MTRRGASFAKGVTAWAALFILNACAAGTDGNQFPGQRGVFHNPYGYGPLFQTPATTEHPPYVICNGRRCALLDEDGNYTQMSDEERRDWRDRIRLAEENRRFNESELGTAVELPGKDEKNKPLPERRTTGDVIPD